MSKTDADIQDNVIIVEMGAAGHSGGFDKRALIATWQNKTVEKAMEVLNNPDIEVTNLSDKEKILPRLPELDDTVRNIYKRNDQERRAATEKAARQAEDGVRQAEEEATRKQEVDHNAAIKAIDAEIATNEVAKQEAVRAEDYEQAKGLKLEIERLQASKAEKISSFRAQRSLKSESLSNRVTVANAKLASLEVKSRELGARLEQAKSGEALERDVELIKSIRKEIETVESEQRSATAAQERAVEDARLRAEEVQRQAAETEQARQRRQAAADAASKELELKKTEIKGQLTEADQKERWSTVEQLQAELKVTLSLIFTLAVSLPG